MSVYARMVEMYQAGLLPWDDPLPPPEVMAFVPTLPVGRALDLGCGTGRAAIYLAGLGWQVDGVDFVPQAIAMAEAAAAQVGLSPRFHLGSVTDLNFLTGPYDFVLDVGCCHTLSLTELIAYRDELKRLLRHAGHYLLFVHLREAESIAEAPPSAGEPLPDGLESTAQAEPRWTDETTLMAVLADGFQLDEVVYGTTQVGDASPWRSAWFWYKRISSDG